MGSFYFIYLENRKILFFNLEFVFYLDFYEILLEFEKKEKDLIECFNKFFEKKVKKEKKIVYYYLSSYKYNLYWKVLYGLLGLDI